MEKTCFLHFFVPGRLNYKWNATNADRLKRQLMLNYDKFTRPNQDDNATEVSFDLTINHIEVVSLEIVEWAYLFFGF